jgi:hypothetical protein
LSALAAVFSTIAGFAVVATPPATADTAPQTSAGTDFWLTFQGNLHQGSLFLFISGSTATTGTVDDPGISFSQAFSVTPGTVTQITLPGNAQDPNSDSVDPYGIHVTAGSPVSVYGLNTFPSTTDGFLGLPTNILGSSYLVEGYTGGLGLGSDFAVVGTLANTTVTIDPVETVGSHPAGTPYTVTLNPGDVYQLGDGGAGDLSGTSITSTNPVAVFAGNGCANVPPTAVACNLLNEEMTPTDTWGTDFLTEPLATRSGDTFRFMASENGTTVTVNGTAVATLNAGQFFETILTSASQINSNNPIQVMQYSNSSSFDQANADPFDITIPPFEQFLNSYTVTTEPNGADPAITNNYINVVAPTSEIGSVTLDGAPIPETDFKKISSTFSGAQLAVAFGDHNLAGPLPFGVTVYGYGGFDGYGYPGGFSLSPIATVSHVTLTTIGGSGAIGTQACSTATVTDQNGNPVSGVRVDFTVTGVNPNGGFAYTDTNGKAQFCYTGQKVGQDSILAAVGSVQSAPAPWTWTLPSTTLSTSLSGGGQSGVAISVPSGTAVTDQAGLAGLNAGSAGGSVTYSVFSDPSCSAGSLVAGGSSQPITAAGLLPASAPVSLSTPGVYYWLASYSGDAGNAASASGCGPAGEVETVTAAATAPVKDDLVTAFKANGKAKALISTSAPNDLLVAFVSGCGPNTGDQTAMVTAKGLTWTFVGRTNTEHGTSEIWSARESSVVSDLKVTATLTNRGFPLFLTVVAFSNATGTGAVSSATSPSGPPTGDLTTTSSPSWVWAVGDDPLASAGRQVPANQTLQSQKFSPTQDTFWVQSLNDENAPAGQTVTINDTAPKYDPYNLTLVEIL